MFKMCIQVFVLVSTCPHPCDSSCYHLDSGCMSDDIPRNLELQG